ncbi:MAG TPA: H-NS histone family protein [Hyphomicrobiaceae bacterium]|nr:H-NS histone family protein [Hyphomicrobiaceae bacterium]
MATVNIDKLSYKDLIELEAKIAVAINKRKAEQKSELKRQMTELAAKSGFELSELVGGKSGSGKRGRGTVAVKYRHPSDASMTWTGRGRQPLWLVAELKKGKKLESFLIK